VVLGIRACALMHPLFAETQERYERAQGLVARFEAAQLGVPTEGAEDLVGAA